MNFLTKNAGSLTCFAHDLRLLLNHRKEVGRDSVVSRNVNVRWVFPVEFSLLTAASNNGDTQLWSPFLQMILPYSQETHRTDNQSLRCPAALEKYAESNGGHDCLSRSHV